LIPRPFDFEPKTLGEHIRRRRLILGITQNEAASQIGVNSFTLGNWEKGHTEPLIQSLPALVAFLGYNPYPTEIEPTIADRLVARRRELGWSQRVAADSLGVHRTTWSDWESGRTILVHQHRRLVARFLGLPEAKVESAMRAQWNDFHRKSEPGDP